MIKSPIKIKEKWPERVLDMAVNFLNIFFPKSKS